MSDVQGTPMGRRRLEAEQAERGLDLGPDIEPAEQLPADVAELSATPGEATLTPLLFPVLTNPQVALLASTIGNSKRNVRADEVEAWADAALEWLDAKDAEREGSNS